MRIRVPPTPRDWRHASSRRSMLRLVLTGATFSETVFQEVSNIVVPNRAFVKVGGYGRSATYFALSGTSMAAPMVSGAAALLLQQNPAITPDQVKARLMMTAFKNLVPAAIATDPTTGQTFNLQADIFTVGSGYLDIQAALAGTSLAPATLGSAMSPIAALDANGNVILHPNGSSVIGSQSILWGTSSVFGQSILWGTGTLSGQSILWGTSSASSTASSGEPAFFGEPTLRTRKSPPMETNCNKLSVVGITQRHA